MEILCSKILTIVNKYLFIFLKLSSNREKIKNKFEIPFIKNSDHEI
jgi:hypothetical protein